MKNFIGTTLFMRCAYLERERCDIRGREDSKGAPRGIRNFRYCFNACDVNALVDASLR